MVSRILPASVRLSTLFRKMVWGMLRSSRNLRMGRAIWARAGSASTTSTAASATISAFMVSWANSTDPGQSMKVQDSPR